MNCFLIYINFSKYFRFLDLGIALLYKMNRRELGAPLAKNCLLATFDDQAFLQLEEIRAIFR